MLVRLTPASRNQNDKVPNTNSKGSPEEKPKANSVITRRSPYSATSCVQLKVRAFADLLLAVLMRAVLSSYGTHFF